MYMKVLRAAWTSVSSLSVRSSLVGNESGDIASIPIHQFRLYMSDRILKCELRGCVERVNTFDRDGKLPATLYGDEDGRMTTTWDRSGCLKLIELAILDRDILDFRRGLRRKNGACETARSQQESDLLFSFLIDLFSFRSYIVFSLTGNISSG